MLRNYPEFIDLLRQRFDRWPWWMDAEYCIRTETPDGFLLDPITAMAALDTHVAYDLNAYREAGRLIGLCFEFSDRIVFAVDLMGAYNAHIRADITEALRLEEPWGREGRWNDPAFHRGPYPHMYDRHPFTGGSTPFTARPVTTRR